MQKDKYGEECKVCNRPFTVFRWCPGPNARYKKTEICQSCAKVKNVCQTCIFDLEYGLPVEVRDRALRAAAAAKLPRSDINREYYHQQLEQQLQESGDLSAPYGGHELVGKVLSNTIAASSISGGGGADMLLKLARTAPYYKRNRPHICSFWVKGHCKRGEECPYRHEKPTDPDDPLSDQNLKDRYYGQNDPVAAKLLAKYESLPKLHPPEDKTVTTLYIGGVPEAITEQDLRNHFYQFGEIRSVHVHHKQHCAFLQFVTREAAEKAAERTYDRLILNGNRLSVNWGKSASSTVNAMISDATMETNKIILPPVPGLPLPLMAPPAPLLTNNYQSSSTFAPIPIKSLNSAPLVPEPQPEPPISSTTSLLDGVDLTLTGPAPPKVNLGMETSSEFNKETTTPTAGQIQSQKQPIRLAPPHGDEIGVHYPSQNPQRMGAALSSLHE